MYWKTLWAGGKRVKGSLSAYADVDTDKNKKMCDIGDRKIDLKFNISNGIRKSVEQQSLPPADKTTHSTWEQAGKTLVYTHMWNIHRVCVAIYYTLTYERNM